MQLIERSEVWEKHSVEWLLYKSFLLSVDDNSNMMIMFLIYKRICVSRLLSILDIFKYQGWAVFDYMIVLLPGIR